MMIRHFHRLLMTVFFAAFSVGCNKGGSVAFREGKSRSARPSPTFNLVPASQAMATSAEGYSAKMELNPVKGQVLRSDSGYTLKLTNTTGN